MIREPIDFIKDITDSIDHIELFLEGFNFDKFCEDRKTVYAIIRAVEIIGEAVKNIPDTIRKDNPDIPWKQIAGMRDKLIHGYFEVDIVILWKTATEELLQLKSPFLKILEIEMTKRSTKKTK
jgi:uncharacterized protein with HEPN domain